MGTVIKIYICENLGEELLERDQVVVVSGKGIVGDRYYNGVGSFSGLPTKNPKKRDVTFVSVENLDAFNESEGLNIPYANFRRNVLTQNIDLNSLIGKEFYVGELKFYGVEACEPCAYLAKLVNKNVLPSLVGKAGLRAEALTSGSLAIGFEFAE